MDKFDKPAYLRNKTNPTTQPTIDDSTTESLDNENKRLKATLNELIDSANHNQRTQTKFSQLELYFLESDSFESLLNRILIELKRQLNLSYVELYLIDQGSEIQNLINEIYGSLDYPNLFYVDSILPIKSIYLETIGITLSQQNQQLERLFLNSSHNCQSAALLPLVRGTKIIGSLHLGSRDIQRFAPSLASHFLQHLSLIISVCIENSLNQERYKHLSLVDILTRAKNRRYFFQALSKEIARSSRSKQPLSCLFIDIDHFKKVNDTFGHLAGDRALQVLVKVINPLLRHSDVLARYGGEEFTVLLPNSDISQAFEIAERIREKIAATEIFDEDKLTFKMTLSIGIGLWEPLKQSFENPQAAQNHIIKTADDALYQAKSQGRNCVYPAINKLNTG